VRRLAVAVIAVVWLGISLDRSQVAIASTKEDWRAAGQFIDANLQTGDAVLAPGGGYVIYHYASHGAEQNVPVDTQEQIADVENHYPRVWLIFDRYLFDPGQAIQTWLQARGAVAFRVDDAITIYYWRAHAAHAALMEDTDAFTLPPTASAYTLLGDQFAETGDLKTAERFYSDALAHAATRAESAQANIAWGDTARRAGNLDQAADHYRTALQDDNNQVAAWAGLGRV